jgi:hypothetical protein
MSFREMISPTNRALASIDFQPATFQGVRSHDRKIPVPHRGFVYDAGDFAKLATAARPPAMPDWPPVRNLCGYGAWAAKPTTGNALLRAMAPARVRARSCPVHGDDHVTAWSGKLPMSDLKGFWGALGRACWAI